MNVRGILAMRMPLVPIILVRMFVNVMMDLREMEKHVLTLTSVHHKAITVNQDTNAITLLGDSDVKI